MLHAKPPLNVNTMDVDAPMTTVVNGPESLEGLHSSGLDGTPSRKAILWAL
jgi:hypothetical protein